MFDEFRYGAGAGGGTREQGGTSPQLASISPSDGDDALVTSGERAAVVVLGGNGATLAVANSFVATQRSGTITAALIPLAWTPMGIAIGGTRQDIGIPLSGLFDWIDRTFPSDDDHAFIAPLRDLELLVRIGWSAPLPECIDESNIVNVGDLPADLVEGLCQPRVTLVQCAACRRLCIAGEFVWKERQLCAWDYHAQAFGKRGPWHEGVYEDRHFATLPACAYVAAPLLAEVRAEPILTLNGLDESVAYPLINRLLEHDGARSHMAVRTHGGFTVLREA